VPFAVNKPFSGFIRFIPPSFILKVFIPLLSTGIFNLLIVVISSNKLTASSNPVLNIG